MELDYFKHLGGHLNDDDCLHVKSMIDNREGEAILKMIKTVSLLGDGVENMGESEILDKNCSVLCGLPKEEFENHIELQKALFSFFKEKIKNNESFGVNESHLMNILLIHGNQIQSELIQWQKEIALVDFLTPNKLNHDYVAFVNGIHDDVVNSSDGVDIHDKLIFSIKNYVGFRHKPLYEANHEQHDVLKMYLQKADVNRLGEVMTAINDYVLPSHWKEGHLFDICGKYLRYHDVIKLVTEETILKLENEIINIMEGKGSKMTNCEQNFAPCHEFFKKYDRIIKNDLIDELHQKTYAIKSMNMVDDLVEKTNKKTKGMKF